VLLQLTEEGSAASVEAQGSNLAYVFVGTIYQEYDYCGSVRAVFNWDPAFRTSSHPGITGAWATSNLFATFGGDSSTSGQVGSLAGTQVISPSMPVHAGGTDAWYSTVLVHLTFATGGAPTCKATGATWDYHAGKQTAADTGCSMYYF